LIEALLSRDTRACIGGRVEVGEDEVRLGERKGKKAELGIEEKGAAASLAAGESVGEKGLGR